MIQGLIKAPEQWNKFFIKFLKARPFERTESTYSPITRQNIDTIINKEDKPPRAITILKEDIEVFVLLVGIYISNEESFQSPITTLPLHCVKSIQIQNFFWSIFSYIQSEYRKIRTRKNSVFGHFSRSVEFS